MMSGFRPRPRDKLFVTREFSVSKIVHYSWFHGV